MNTRFKLRVLLAMLLLVLCAGAYIGFDKSVPNSVSDGTSTKVDTISFRLKWFIYSSFAHHFVALDTGMFTQQSLDVNIEPGGAGLDPIKLVASGVNDVGLASYAQILLARDKGIPVVAIGEEYIQSGVVFLTLADSGIFEPKQFIGKTVGIVPGSDPSTVYQAMMAKLGIDRSKTTEIPVGFDLLPLIEKKVDVWSVAYITNQPIMLDTRGIKVNIIDPTRYGVSVGGNVFFTSEKTLTEKKSALKRFMQVDLRAIMVSKSMPDDDVVSIVLKHNDKLSRETELKIWQATKERLLSSDPRTIGVMPEKTWRDTADVFYKQGLLKMSPDLSKCYTNAIVEEVHREGIPSR